MRKIKAVDCFVVLLVCAVLTVGVFARGQTPATYTVGSVIDCSTSPPTLTQNAVNLYITDDGYDAASACAIAKFAQFGGVASNAQASLIALMQSQINALQQQVTALNAKVFPPPPPPTPAPTAVYALSLSMASNRSNAIALNGSSFGGAAYIFTSNAANLGATSPIGIANVVYSLDGIQVHTEAGAPYDFAGTAADGTATPWASTSVANGQHTITQKVTLASGAIETDSATFTVAN